MCIFHKLSLNPTSASPIIRLRTSSNTRNQAVIQDGCVDIQNNIIGYAGNGNKNVGRTNRNQATNAGNGLVQNIEEYDQNVQRVQRTESTPGKNKCIDNNFMLDNAYGDNTLEELNAAVIMMERIQPTDDKSDA
ncbi:hypothetical protein Tco_1352459 [Tanacetum coccineum]